MGTKRSNTGRIISNIFTGALVGGAAALAIFIGWNGIFSPAREEWAGKPRLDSPNQIKVEKLELEGDQESRFQIVEVGEFSTKTPGGRHNFTLHILIDRQTGDGTILIPGHITAFPFDLVPLRRLQPQTTPRTPTIPIPPQFDRFFNNPPGVGPNAGIDGNGNPVDKVEPKG